MFKLITQKKKKKIQIVSSKVFRAVFPGGVELAAQNVLSPAFHVQLTGKSLPPSPPLAWGRHTNGFLRKGTGAAEK